ncbi:OsmC family protein [Simiduia curdlanivorans]|uniref:OsmC family protein n=1 Tax=Simiduia curdlanivorans TaxID=1492769 RepID=A0ABV8V300_9GAMM|nr:OsmC family protein [Simiduia curdlanivorans]MDN3637679.1 OsmC family protein [Simiduia curdlanivorans]
MQPLPHHYHVQAQASTDTLVQLNSGELETLSSAPPVQFGGDGKHWSPEEFLLAAVADCYILSFKAVSTGSNFRWQDLTCAVEGILEREGKVTRFTRYILTVALTCRGEVDRDKAQKLLTKAENVCLISNSLNGSFELHTEIIEQA